jgi:DNA-binding response OmpR family regulator
MGHAGISKVAVVDDDREVRDGLKDSLSDAGFEVMRAANGLRLISTLQVDRPDVILLDIMMSWIDGRELCRALKKNQEFCDIPVVFISGKTSPEDIQTGLSCGAVDYFPKPIDSRKLIRRLKEIVS